ncbi:MAG: HlyC/CorC family transporter [Phycisphaerae bacterium]|nr:HlyC/CorC family transporter [Phycisphaerae bacterium]
MHEGWTGGAKLVEAFRDNVPHLLALCGLVIISGLVSSSETALFSLTRQQLGRFRQSSHLLAQLVLRLREKPESLLSTVLLANIAVNVLLYSMLAVTVNRFAGPSSLWAMVSGGVGFLVVLFGAEIVPKLVAFAMSERLAPLVAGPVRLLEIVTWPVRWVLGVLLVEPLTRILGGGVATDPDVRADELQQLVNICQTNGLIDERENTLLHQMMGLANMRVAELMVPRVDVVAFDLASERSELVALIQSSRLLRIPAYKETIDNVKGVISAKEFLLNQDRPPAELVRPVRFIPEQASVEALLLHFKTTGSKLAMVVDEYGGLAGIVALEDVVEAIVGELHAPDEPEIRPALQRLSDTTFMIDAGLDVDDFYLAFDLPIEESRINTVGGLIAAKLDRVPRQGDQVAVGRARLTVVSMKDHRILQARLVVDEPVEDNPDLSRLLDATPPDDGEQGEAARSEPA